MRTCSKCRVEKPWADFYKHKNGTNGHCSACKLCMNASREKYRQNNLPVFAERMKVWRKKTGRRYIETIRSWEQRNKEKRIAHTRVKEAKLSGRLVPQPCEVCSAAKVEAHHDDYSRPLDVRWLCKRHHAALHLGIKHREKVLKRSVRSIN